VGPSSLTATPQPSGSSLTPPSTSGQDSRAAVAVALNQAVARLQHDARTTGPEEDSSLALETSPRQASRSDRSQSIY
jgi:hypothetical protein